MKKVIYLLLAAFACSCSGGSYTLSGEAQGAKAGDSVMIYSYYDKSERFAAAVVAEDGTFALSGKIQQPAVAALVLNGRVLLAQFFLEKGDLTATEANSGGTDITGSRYNDAMVRFKEENIKLEGKFSSIDSNLSPEEATAERDAIYQEYVDCIDKTISANLDNIFGAYIFAGHEFNRLDVAEAQARIDSFDENLLSLDFMAPIVESIANLGKTDIGQPYIDITLSSIEGNEVSVSELVADGKYVLIDFWATWCSPCMNELPHLKAAYEEYKDKDFEIYGISLDRNEMDWKSVVSSQMPWVNVLNSAESSATVDYAVRTIPTNILVSPEGIIIAKNLRGEAVAETLAEYLD